MIAHISDFPTANLATGTPLTSVHSLTSVPADTLIVVVLDGAYTTSRTFTETTSGLTWKKQAAYTTNAGGPEYWTAFTAAGGNITLTFTHGSNSGDFRTTGALYSGFLANPASPVDDDLYINGTTTTSHVCSATGLTQSGELLGISGGGNAATNGNTTAGSGWAKLPQLGSESGVNRIHYQWKVFPSGTTAETGAYTTSTARQNRNLIALLAPPVPGTSLRVTGGFLL